MKSILFDLQAKSMVRSMKLNIRKRKAKIVRNDETFDKIIVMSKKLWPSRKYCGPC